MLAGVEMVHVPIGAGPAMTDLIGGQVQVMFVAPVVAVEQIAAGGGGRWRRQRRVPTRCRAAGGRRVCTGLRVQRLVWHRAQGHAGRNRVEAQSRGPRASPILRCGKIDALGGGIAASSPEDFGKLIAVETEKWGKVVRFAGIKPE